MSHMSEWLTHMTILLMYSFGEKKKMYHLPLKNATNAETSLT